MQSSPNRFSVLFPWQSPLSSSVSGCPSSGIHWKSVCRPLPTPDVPVGVAGPLHPHTNPRYWSLRHDLIQLHGWQLQPKVYSNNFARINTKTPYSTETDWLDLQCWIWCGTGLIQSLCPSEPGSSTPVATFVSLEFPSFSSSYLASWLPSDSGDLKRK